MQLHNSKSRWGAISQSLHWIVVTLIITQFILAEIAEDLPTGLQKLVVLSRHKSIGILILALAVTRLVWRWISAAPQPVRQSRLQAMAAAAAHCALYALLLLTPLTGWLMSSARGYTVSFFSLFELPNFVARGETLFNVFKEAHELMAQGILWLAVLHALSALAHHFVLKDDVMRRMLPRFRKTP